MKQFKKPRNAASGERMKMKNFNNDFSIDEAVRVLSAYGLEEVQKVLNLSDDDIIEILLNDCQVWHTKIMEWYSRFSY